MCGRFFLEAAYSYDDLTTFEVSAFFHCHFCFRPVCFAMVSALMISFFAKSVQDDIGNVLR